MTPEDEKKRIEEIREKVANGYTAMIYLLSVYDRLAQENREMRRVLKRAEQNLLEYGEEEMERYSMNSLSPRTSAVILDIRTFLTGIKEEEK